MKNTSIKFITPTFILCLFFGFVGIHCFYVGNNKRGLMMILVGLCTIFIGSSIWSLVDLVILAGRNFKDGKGNVLTKW